MDAAGKVLAEFVWLGSAGALRSTTRVLDVAPCSVEDIPALVVQLDENAVHCNAAAGSDIVLKPRKMFRDPLRGGDHLLVLCDTFEPPQVQAAGPTSFCLPLQPHATNMRAPCQEVLNHADHMQQHPMLAVQQEYYIPQDEEYNFEDACNDSVQHEPAGSWPHAHLPDPTKPYLYGPKGELAQKFIPNAREAALARQAAARRLSETHLQMCLHAGLKITGCGDSDSEPGVWNYKLGPLSGIDLGDQLWISRHLLLRLSEAMGIPVVFDSNALKKHLLSCLFKYSTASSRDPKFGTAVIQQYLGRLQASHVQHMHIYGRGSNPDSSKQSAWGSKVGCATALAVPTTTALRGHGHITDRRPAANADPYAVIIAITSTTLNLSVMNQLVAGTSHSDLMMNASQQGGFAMQQAAALNAQLVAAAQLANLQQQFAAAAAMMAAAVQNNTGSYGSQQVAYNRQAADSFLAGRPAMSGQSLSWGHDDEDDIASLNTEDVLLEELDRMDGVVDDLDEMCDSCCSDGTSPETKDYEDEVTSHSVSIGPAHKALPIMTGAARQQSAHHVTSPIAVVVPNGKAQQFGQDVATSTGGIGSAQTVYMLSGSSLGNSIA